MLAAEESSPSRPTNPEKSYNIDTKWEQRKCWQEVKQKESNNDEYDSEATDSRGEDDSSTVILACINFEDANERPNATCSVWAITRRSQIDFSFL